MTTKFTPFVDDQSLVITDTHGNELNVQNDTSQLTIYGQWQGKLDSPEFNSFIDMLKDVQDTLSKESFVASKEQDGFSLSKKKDEVFLDVDVNLEKNLDSAEKIFKIFNKMKKLKKM